LERALADGVFPGAALSFGDADGEKFRTACGFRALFPERLPLTESTLFDLASLTKIFATSFVALKLVERAQLRLDDPLETFFPCPPDKARITIRQLMTHTSGLPAHIDLRKFCRTAQDALPCILRQPLLYAPSSEVTYSCLGYIVLGKICEDVTRAPLDELAVREVFAPLGMRTASYRPSARETFASTEFDPETRSYLCGTVHDENARFLGGVSGNAGVFAALDDCAVFARMLANSGAHNGKELINRALFTESVRNHTAGCSQDRGLGFLLKRDEDSSAGTRMVNGAYGHTGFTGTSLWVCRKTRRYVTLLTNRVHPTRDNNKLAAFRAQIADACLSIE
jgi:CubicO group peptidase (beta-lactamase class C family)